MKRIMSIGFKVILGGLIFRFFTGISPVRVFRRFVKKTREKSKEIFLGKKRKQEKKIAESPYEIH